MFAYDMEFSNVSELYKDETGAYKLLRVPSSVADACCQGVRNMNGANCGVEIRFIMEEDEVKLRLRCDDKCARPAVFYGSIPAGWQECLKNVYSEETEITVKRPSEDEFKMYEKIAREYAQPFDPHVVRLVFSNTATVFISKEGKTSVPARTQVPKKRYLAYGSSITHGSLAISQLNLWTYRIARDLDCDLLNLGMAGSAQLEPAMADYIAGRDDWDFATLEMGINILNIEPEDFRSRAEYFIKTIAEAHPDKKVFCIDVFYCAEDLRGGKKADTFREIIRETVEKLALKNTVYVPGLEILDGAWGLSGDLTHPNAYACEVMGGRLVKVIRDNQ